jgi:hypothetical protein
MSREFIKHPPTLEPLTAIVLKRGESMVSTLTGAFGQSLRETRLTALLGYLIALDPIPFLDLFGFSGVPQQVCLETCHENGRSDILIETNRGTGIVEAKIDATDPLVQARRYPARWVALLTHRIPRAQASRGTSYVTWQQLADLLKRLSHSHTARLRFLSTDLLAYMEEHRMTKKRDSVEIYAREINEPVTLKLFLKAGLYGCTYEAGSHLAEALYFAPHLGQRISKMHPGISTGISYIARIESVGYATKWREFQDLLIKERGRVWMKSHAEILRELHGDWSWTEGEQRCFLFLGQPRLAFNPPVRKENLQVGKGWLSKRFLSFDELFEAWGK